MFPPLSHPVGIPGGTEGGAEEQGGFSQWLHGTARTRKKRGGFGSPSARTGFKLSQAHDHKAPDVPLMEIRADPTAPGKLPRRAGLMH